MIPIERNDIDMDNKKMLYKIANELDKLGYSENADNIRNEIGVLNETSIDAGNYNGIKIKNSIWIDISGYYRDIDHKQSPRAKIETKRYGRLPVLIPWKNSDISEFPKKVLKLHARDGLSNTDFKDERTFITKYKDIFLTLYFSQYNKNNIDEKHSIGNVVKELFANIKETNDANVSLKNILFKYPEYNKTDFINLDLINKMLKESNNEN